MDFDAVAYLASKGHRGTPASGGREMTYACFFDCEEPANSKKRKLYLNVGETVYDCKVCGASGGSWTLQKHFGDEPRQGTSDDPFTRRRILDAATATGVTILHENDDAMRYLFNERGLTVETIDERKLGFIAGAWSLTGTLPEGITAEQLKGTGLVYREGPRAGNDFYYRHLLIPYLSRGHCIQMRGRAWGETKGGKYISGPGEPVRVYNSDSLDGAEEVLIVEGEFDTMILAQTLQTAPEARLRKLAILGLAGTGAIPEELDDLLSPLKRIYLGLDSDEAGGKAAEKLKDRLGNRARILQLPYEDGRKCDWTEYLLPAQSPSGNSTWRYDHPYAGHSWRDIHRLLVTASGKRIFSVAEAGEAFRAYREVNTGIALGYGVLDGWIKPGLLPGQVAIVLAKTGAGKTVFLCNLAYNMRQHRVLLVSLEMTREEVYDRLRRIYLFHHPEATEAQAEDALSNIYICDENRLGERDLGILIAEFKVEAEATPDVVMIDYLGYYARGARGNTPYEKASNAVMQLKAEAKAGRFVVIAPSQVNRGSKEGRKIDLDDARDSGAVEETADFLMALYRPDDAAVDDTSALKDERPPTGLVILELLKSRHGNKGKSIRLLMDLITLALVPELHTKASRVKQHNTEAWNGLDWPELRRRETAPLQQHLNWNGPSND